MPDSITAFLFPSVPAVFPSDYSLAESVERLRDLTVDDFSRFFRTSPANGTVTEEWVHLARLTPLSSNYYRPQFFGSFQQTAQGVVLSGRFTMAKWAKVYTGLGLGFAACCGTLMFVGMLFGGPSKWWGLPIGPGFIALGVGVQKLNQWMAHNDVPHLSRTIARALTTPDKWPAEEPPKPGWLRKRFFQLAGQ